MKKNKKKSKGFFSEFRSFINRGNVMDMAVGVIIGGAFKGIIDSLVSDVIMPLLSLVTGGLDFSNWFISFDGSYYSTLEEAKSVGAPTLNYGAFLTVVINFLLMALVVFFIVKCVNKLNERFGRSSAAKSRKCPYCQSEISIAAVRCPHCTSQLPALEKPEAKVQ